MKVEHTLPIQEWWKDRKEIISDEVGEKSRVFTAQQLIDLDCNFDHVSSRKRKKKYSLQQNCSNNILKNRAALDHEIDKTLSEFKRFSALT